MAALRICLYDPSGSEDSPFALPFAELRDVQVVATCPRWDPLHELLASTPPDVVAVNLDSQGDELAIHVVQWVAEVAPDCGIVGVSAANDPEAIIAAMRAGCSQFVRWPIDPTDLQSAIDRIRTKRQPLVAGSKRICVIGSAGGAGTTTIACNLAIELAQHTRHRSGLVDLNLEFGDVACAFDCKPQYSITDVARDGVELDRTVLETAMHQLDCDVSILTRPDRLEEAREVTSEGIDQTLRLMAQLFPFVVVDLPRTFNYLSAAAVGGADHALIITQLAVPSLRNATRIYQSLLHMGANEEGIEIVLNRCNANFERITPDEVEEHFSKPIFGVVPNDYRRVTSSRDLGQPIMAEAPNSPARIAIQELARKLADGAAKDRSDEPANSGLLSKFWRRKPAGSGARR